MTIVLYVLIFVALAMTGVLIAYIERAILNRPRKARQRRSAR